MRVLDKEEVKLKRHDKENDNKGGVSLTSAAARQKETKMQEKVKIYDQRMKRQTVKRCKTSQVTEIGFC